MKNYQTRQRNQLLLFFEKHCDEQLTIDDIIKGMPQDSGISRSAVYRNIDRMAEDGLVRKSAGKSSRSFVYRYVGGTACCKHLHMQCDKCGKIYHMESEADEAELKNVLKKNGFKLDEQQTLLRGVCKKCN